MPGDGQKPQSDNVQMTDNGARAVLVASLMAAIIAMIVIAGFKIH